MAPSERKLPLRTEADAGGQPEYALGHSEPELERLSAQARLVAPFTRNLFREGGIQPGMRVLDVGCGHGDVTLLAAEIVGPLGQVVGVDKAPAAVEAARRRAAQARNVEVVLGDVGEAKFHEPFDAAVGRAVLMYCQDPVEALAAVARWVRPGGPVIFQEFDLRVVRSHPRARLYEETLRLAIEAVRLAGADDDMGLGLHRVYTAAGLPAPAIRYEAAVGRADDTEVFEIVTDIVRSVLPSIERLGLGTAGELQPETLAGRMRDEVVGRNGVVAYPPLVGAHARRPSDAAG